MEVTMKVKSFEFQANNEKEAYIKGCKNLAKYMASKNTRTCNSELKEQRNQTHFGSFCLQLWILVLTKGNTAKSAKISTVAFTSMKTTTAIDAT